MAYKTIIDKFREFFATYNVRKGPYIFHGVPSIVTNILMSTGYMGPSVSINPGKTTELYLHGRLRVACTYCVYNFTKTVDDVNTLATILFSRIKNMYSSRNERGKYIVFIEEGDERDKLELILKQMEFMDYTFVADHITDDEKDLTIAYLTVYHDVSNIVKLIGLPRAAKKNIKLD